VASLVEVAWDEHGRENDDGGHDEAADEPTIHERKLAELGRPTSYSRLCTARPND
jgi:hypothetical protein